MRVLIAQADREFARERAEQLLMDGHDSLLAATGPAARVKLAGLPDALLLGPLERQPATIALLRELRCGAIPGADDRLPVLVVGADGEPDQIRYLQAGADILLPASASPLLIAAALDALHRRMGAPAPRMLRIANIAIDLDARTVEVQREPLALTRLEFDLLRALATQPGRTFTRAELTRDVWGYDPAATGPSRTIDSTAHRLQRKLKQAGAGQVMHSVRGVGWRVAR